jgi:hypothetical protein
MQSGLEFAVDFNEFALKIGHGSGQPLASAAHRTTTGSPASRHRRTSAMALTVERILRIRKALASLWRPIARELFDPYRPELHYMRGPGPKWREKHAGETPVVSGLSEAPV